ncbi:DsbD_2 domain-containing protein [Gammaproteobacteria bacterium]
MQFTSVLSAFLMGLLGSIHCVGMCGGIAGALSMRIAPEVRSKNLLLYLLTYNFGRILTYTFVGALIGLLGNQFVTWLPEPRKVSLYVSGAFMIGLGLYLGSWWPSFALLEKAGAKLWRWIAPLDQYFFPVSSPWRMLGVGLVWGWLPCGLVYTALTLALAASLDSPSRSALLMFAFGLGTLPALVATGSAVYGIGKITQQLWVRRVAGILIILFGIYGMLMPHAGHGNHGSPSQHSTTEQTQHEHPTHEHIGDQQHQHH